MTGSSKTSACLAFVTAILAASCGEPQRPGVVLITVDTLRADALGTYGAPEGASPNIDRLARESTVFDSAAAPMPLTRPSHFSIFTAQYPREHGVLNNATSLPPSTITLAETLQEVGYHTGGFVGVSILGPDSGAAQGFEAFGEPTKARERPADEVVREALSWLDQIERGREFFLWVHLFDPHIPYDPPASYRPPALANLPGLSTNDLEEIAVRNDGDVPLDTLQLARDLYRGEVTYIDHWIGELLRGLEERIDLEETAVVFTADHGECFENGVYFEHADCLFQPALQIPLIVRYPRAFPPGVRIDTSTSLVDIAPTILQLAGLTSPGEPSGRPLQSIRDGEERYVLFQYPFFQQRAARRRPEQRQRIRSVAGNPTVRYLMDRERVGLVGRDWKYWRDTEGEVLFQLSPVVDERRNLATDRPRVRRQMMEMLDRALDAHPLEVLSPGKINDELRETLEALGYL